MKKLILIAAGLLLLNACSGNKGGNNWNSNVSGQSPCGTTQCNLITGQMCYYVQGTPQCVTSSISCSPSCTSTQVCVMLQSGTTTCANSSDLITDNNNNNNNNNSGLVGYGGTYTGDASTDCRSGVAQVGFGGKICGCSDLDPCTDDGYICHTSTNICGMPVLATSDSSNSEGEPAPYGFSDIKITNTGSCPDRYLEIPVDLNKSVGGDTIYFCLKYANRGQSAVNGMYFTISGNAGCSPADGYTCDPIDLNRGTGNTCSDYIYMNIEKGTSSIFTRFRAVLNTYYHNSDAKNACTSGAFNYTYGNSGTTPADLNDGCGIGSDWIYACYTHN